MLSSNLTTDTAVQNYPYLAYTGAINANAPSDKRDIPSFSKLTWQPNATGWYIAEGDLVWMAEGPSWVFFLPHGNVAVKYPDVQKGMASLTISGLSDTLSTKNNEITQRLTWIAAGFSILLHQPILEALFVNESAPPQQTPAKLQGLWHQHKLWRKSRSRQIQTT
jgi:hypothetical protein